MMRYICAYYHEVDGMLLPENGGKDKQAIRRVKDSESDKETINRSDKQAISETESVKRAERESALAHATQDSKNEK